MRAYVATVLLVTLRPWQVADKVAMPVSLRAAKRFRRITLLVAFAPVLAGAPLVRAELMPALPDPQYWWNEWVRLVANPWSLGACLLGLFVGLWAATRVATAAFIPRRLGEPRRGRAVAVTCYACAPVAWLSLATGLALAGTFLAWRHEPSDQYSDAVARLVGQRLLAHSPYVAAAVVLAWLRSTLWILAVSTGCTWRRVVTAAAVLPASWAVLIVLAPTLTVLLAAVAVVMVLSLS